MNEAEPWLRRWLRVDVILTVVGIGAGLAGALLAARYLSARASAAEAEAAARYQTREVVVASADVPRGATLGRQNLALRRIPQQFLPADAIPADRAGVLMGSRTAISIGRGTPIAMAVLAAGDMPQRLSEVLAPNERALTVAVDELNSQAGALRVGDRLDLFYSRREGNEALLAPLIQQVEVLAVGGVLSPEVAGDEQRYSSVTLRVTAADAPAVLLAQQAGDLFALLRGPGDRSFQSMSVRNSRELMRRSQGPVSSGGVELLIGGAGGLVPERVWLAAGAARTGDAT